MALPVDDDGRLRALSFAIKAYQQGHGFTAIMILGVCLGYGFTMKDVRILVRAWVDVADESATGAYREHDDDCRRDI